MSRTLAKLCKLSIDIPSGPGALLFGSDYSVFSTSILVIGASNSAILGVLAKVSDSLRVHSYNVVF